MRLFWLLLALCLPMAAMAQDYPAPASDTVTDLADLLPPDAEARVSQALASARQATGVHVVLVTMGRIADHGGANQRIEEYAKTLFNAWGIGDGTRNDGVLILVAAQDRTIRIALGSGYDAVWDNAAQRAIDTGFLPAFRIGQMADGIEQGVGLVISLVARPFAAGQPAPDVPAEVQPSIWHLLVFGGAFAALTFRRRIADALVVLRRCPACGHRGLQRSRGTTAPTEGWVETRCPACGEGQRTTHLIRPPSDRSGGGFGGGRSSGGGATGRW